ncbi:MATE family efflux transporter [Gilvimarinus sp. F26214L]|uniref:MATE family efflux transporter n=1 Tax=Gilvimarinus sp. DZF01 TaxID=3461371 RepID=UPI0040460FBD
MIHGSVAGHLRTMALPMVWGLLASMSFNAVDTLFVAQLGEGPLAAMAFTFPVIMVVTSIAIGLGAGASSAISRTIGAGDDDKVRRLVTDAITLATLISVAVCVLGWFTIDPLFVALGATPDLLPFIHDYMAIWYLSAPFLMVPMISLSALRALGQSHIQGSLMVAAAVLNAILDPLLIFGLGGFPRLEIQGAAIASLVTRVMTLLVAFYVLHKHFRVFVSPLAGWRQLQASWRTVFHVGLPAIASNLIIPVASGITVKLVAGYGVIAVAGLGVALRIEPIALIVFYALSGVVGPFCGQNKGAGHYDRLFETLRVITVFCLLFGFAMALVLWLSGPYVGRLFSDSETVLEVVTLYLAIVPVSYGAYGLVMSVNAMFNGLAKPVPGLVISFLRVMGVYLPLAFAGMWLWGLTGLFVAAALSNGVVALIAHFWLSNTMRAEAGQHELAEAPQKT